MPPTSGERPHALYVAWGFPPARTGGVYRALATANALVSGGFEVTVLTADRETFEKHTGVDPSLEGALNPSVRVERVPFVWPYAETDRSAWPALRRLAPRVWWRARKILDQVHFPEVVYGRWRRPLEDAAVRVHRERPVDLVVATANPNVDFAAAARLGREGVPYVLDYRDAWLLDVFDGRQVHSDRSRAARLERSLIAGAAQVWFVNEPIRQWHADRYPEAADRMRVVANGFDPDFAPLPRTRPPESGRPLRFGYIGTVSSKVPVEPFLAGWAAAAGTDALDGATAHLYGHVGFHGGSAAAPAWAQALPDGVSLEGPVAKGDLRSTYETFDVLLLLLGSGRYVTSGKIYEYAASALPIVAIHDPGNAASDVLRDYPLWFPVKDLSPVAIADALQAAASAARTADAATRQSCVDFADQYRRELQLDPPIAALRTAMGRPHS